MGNHSNQKISQDFKLTCHPVLASCHIDEQQSIFLDLEFNSIIQAWMNTIEPLQKKNSKHLLLPYKIQKNEPDNEGCFAGNYQDPKVQIFYQPFIYTLDKEIVSRKQNLCRFQQWQIWKIMGNCADALSDWKYVYPLATIGKVKPINMVLDSRGKIKLINQLTVPYDHRQANSKNLMNNRIYRQLDKKSKPILILKGQQQGQSIRQLGLTMLQILTLQKTPQSDLTVEQKKQKMYADVNYSIGLKRMIENLIYTVVTNETVINQIKVRCDSQIGNRGREK